jgi:hypothetical protein
MNPPPSEGKKKRVTINSQYMQTDKGNVQLNIVEKKIVKSPYKNNTGNK